LATLNLLTNMSIKNFFYIPIPGISFRVWVKTIFTHRIGIWYIPKAIFITLSSFFGIPFRLYERLYLKKRLKETQIDQPPLFILGHWRSGTTLLVNTMSQDPQFGIVTIHQAAFPYQFICNKLFLWFAKLAIPKTRPMDNMEMAAHFSQEEDFALANMSTHSFFHCWTFPKSIHTFYDQYVQFIDSKKKMYWKQVYEKMLKITTINMSGKRILLKNPPNTGRIKLLLEMYPDAKFIHIYRNPYTVYFSTKKLYQKSTKLMRLQNLSPEQESNIILTIYKRLMQDYFDQASCIPKGNLVEIRFEDLEKDNLGVIKHIYDSLSLPNFEVAEPHIKTYLDTLKTYSKNDYEIDDKTINTIQQHWKFTIDKWEYSVPK